MNIIKNTDPQIDWGFIDHHFEQASTYLVPGTNKLYVFLPVQAIDCFSTKVVFSDPFAVEKVEFSANEILCDVTNYILGNEPEEYIPAGLATYSYCKLVVTLKSWALDRIPSATLKISRMKGVNAFELSNKFILIFGGAMRISNGIIGIDCPDVKKEEDVVIFKTVRIGGYNHRFPVL